MSMMSLAVGLVLSCATSKGSACGGVDGRSICAESRFFVAANYEAHGAAIRFAGRTVKITKDEVQVPGQPALAIPADCKAIKVCNEKEIHILFDGVEAKPAVR